MDTGSGRSGCAAETRALVELQAAGLRLVARNFRTRLGEIDLVMLDGCTLVFVEVRLRSDARRGGALGSIGPRKCQRLRAAAAVFLARNRRLAAAPARFDVVAYAGPEGPGNWIRNAFS